MPSIVLQEFVWFFKGVGFSVTETWEILNGYTKDPRFKGLNDTPKVVENALRILIGENLSLSRFNDAMILVHALEKGAFVTFDSKFRKLAKRQGVKVLP
ncbi:PIN domain-containing protein [Thermococcus chitonophagus]|uniref:PIN domain-containing protein n=1 Tax=Thermococcus chitonophagus TaxID=54262 RepID=UPI001E2A1E6D|nr:PIN domain-containing protein [Thermococcus chitonophagus]